VAMSDPISEFAKQMEEAYAEARQQQYGSDHPFVMTPSRAAAIEALIEGRGPVMAIGEWRNNAELIRDVARLGYLSGHVLDATYGKGRFWKLFQPERFTTNDLHSELAQRGYDFRLFPPLWAEEFDAVVFDPPYKLNGTPSGQMDDDYGVGEKASRQARMNLITDGLIECLRVLKPKGYLLVKCQDMVSGGKVRWQSDEITSTVTLFGHEKVDAFHLLSYRPQPAGTTQQHARRNYSTLLVFRKAP
jgi:hypothetical protein